MWFEAAVLIVEKIDNVLFAGRLLFLVIIFEVLVLVWPPNSVCKVPFVKCASNEPSIIFHHGAEEFIIGGIISLIFISSDEMTFSRHPFEDKIMELM